jgi:hypothetical protein
MTNTLNRKRRVLGRKTVKHNFKVTLTSFPFGKAWVTFFRKEALNNADMGPKDRHRCSGFLSPHFTTGSTKRTSRAEFK